MRIKNERDFWAGILFAACGLFFIITAQENELGSAARMGPAYFPTLLAGCLTALGLFCSVKGLFSTGGAQDGGRVGRFHFGLMILILGAIALIVVLCGLCWVIFVYLLGMTIPVFPEFMVGE